MVTPLQPLSEQVSPAVLLLLSSDMKPRAEMHLVSFTGDLSLNSAGEGEAVVHLHRSENHESIEPLLRPWSTVALLSSEATQGPSAVLWVGRIVKAVRLLGEPKVRLALREWQDWLGRVWTHGVTAEYPQQGDSTDGAFVVYDRIQAAMQACRTGELKPPIGLVAAPPSINFPVEVDFFDQQDEPSPRSIAAEIEEVVALGVEWWVQWKQEIDGSIYPVLRVGTYDPSSPPDLGIIAGSDASEMGLEHGTSTQVTKLKVIGAYGLSALAEVPVSQYSPPLWEVRSYEQVGTHDPDDATALPKLQALANAISAQHSNPLLITPDLPLVGLRKEFEPGHLVEVSIERDFDPTLAESTSFVARVMVIRYSIQDGKALTTLTLASPTAPGGSPTPTKGEVAAMQRNTPGTTPPPQILPSSDPVAYMRELGNRVSALEARRDTEKRPTP